jgi:glycosyltransferase involved in cell wall biosynthesis
VKRLPTISVVVPSFNQASYLPETLQSLVDQAYPALEVVIQDGGSSDGSIAIAEDYVQRYPSIFRLFVEKDFGQADALNRGFQRSGGDILAFLNSDDTYLAGTLHHVAEAIDPSRGRYVIMGRCLFTGEHSPYVGVEHPAEYINHFEHLAIWKRGFNTIPQPSVFWHRSVWERCGGFNIGENHVLDYDLFCRFSRYYRFHRIDELFSTYRMHDKSKSSQRSEAQVLELSISVSRKYWGPWWSLLRWRCEFSYWLHNRHLHDRARHHARRAEEAFRKGQYRSALIEFALTLINAPSIARDGLLYGWFAGKTLRVFEALLWAKDRFTGRYSDGWIGPVFREQLTVPEQATRLTVGVEHYPHAHHRRKIKVRLLINRRVAQSKVVNLDTSFYLVTDVAPYRGQQINLEIRTNSSFVAGAEDRRLLSIRLNEINIATG